MALRSVDFHASGRIEYLMIILKSKVLIIGDDICSRRSITQGCYLRQGQYEPLTQGSHHWGHRTSVHCLGGCQTEPRGGLGFTPYI
jgi:hypothetical protein